MTNEVAMSTSKCNFSLERAKVSWRNGGSRPREKMYKVSQEHLVFQENREAIKDHWAHVKRTYEST